MSFYDKDDISDNMAGINTGKVYFGTPVDKNGMVIQFYHIATIKKSIDNNYPNGSQATFKAFLTSFKDNFKVNWNQKQTYGRMDPVQIFKNTQRSINIEFEVPSHSQEEAIVNFKELEKLIMMQYPVYETVMIGTTKNNLPSTLPTNAPTDSPADQKNKKDQSSMLQGGNITKRFMSSPPLLYVKFLNWIDNSGPVIKNQTGFEGCLVGVISEVNFTPDLEVGVYLEDSKLIPKLFNVNLNINIIHTKELGWTDTVSVSGEKLDNHVFGEPLVEEGDQSGFIPYPSFPYGMDEYIYMKKK